MTKKTPEIANDNQPQTTMETPANENQQTEDLAFSADEIGGDWDSSTDHLDSITEASDKVDAGTGLKASEMLTEDEFFKDFFCQNMALVEQMFCMVGFSVVMSGGKPEYGARETSNLLYSQCKKFRFLAWALKKKSDLQDIFAIAMFAQAKGKVVACHFAKVPEPDKKPTAANDNLEPLEETA